MECQIAISAQVGGRIHPGGLRALCGHGLFGCPDTGSELESVAHLLGGWSIAALRGAAAA